MEYLESQVFEIKLQGDAIKKVEFKVCELPNDMKMLCFLAGELSNGATYFSTFANKKQDESNDFKKTFGFERQNYWQPFTYEKRISDAEKVLANEKQLENGK